jgi:hypothetical protein
VTKGKGNSERGDVSWGKVDPVKTIRNIDFNKVYWAVTRVSMYDILDDALEGPTKLHGFRCRKGQGVSVNTKESVIHNCPRSPFTLGDNTNWADAKVGKVLDSGVGEDHPLSFLDHVAEFRGEKVGMQVC